MNGYLLPVCCPCCGSSVEHLTASTLAGTETSASLKCSKCRRSFAVIVHLRPVIDPVSETRRKARA